MKSERMEILLSRTQISERVKELGEVISRDYEHKDLLMLCVLKGGIIFVADLIRNLKVMADLDFIVASSYRRTDSTGEVELSPMLSAAVCGKDVLVVEDIVDTGLTYRSLSSYLMSREPASLRLCTLLDKPSDRRIGPIRADYIGFTIPDKFVVGYGLDYEGKYRGLQDICALAV